MYRNRKTYNSSVRIAAGPHIVRRNIGKKTRNIKNTACVYERPMRTNMILEAAAGCSNSSYLVNRSQLNITFDKRVSIL